LVDFRERGESRDSQSSGEEGAPELRALLSQAESFFRKLLEAPESSEEVVPIQLILDVFRFITSTRQHGALGDFLEHIEAKAPPFVVAAFETQAEAQDWLANHSDPPLFADVLIANKYHDVVYERETDFRRLPWNRHLERHLAWLQRENPPVAAASFSTREEAEAWLANQPHPARRAWVMIAGEFYLAAYHPNIGHRALYPLSMARGYEQETADP
jgi:beta-phosphoglucomutase-like phosphatase (HAD superfamily)